MNEISVCIKGSENRDKTVIVLRTIASDNYRRRCTITIPGTDIKIEVFTQELVDAALSVNR